MWNLWAKLSAGALIASVIGGAIISQFHTGRVEWLPVLVISTCATSVVAGRLFFLLRKERARLIVEQEVFRDAAQELIDHMAGLSAADHSIYVTAVQLIDTEFEFLSAQGSPNHRAFVQMSDLGLMRPIVMRRLGGGPDGPVVVQYALTPDGHASLPNLLDIVSNRRRWFASQA